MSDRQCVPKRCANVFFSQEEEEKGSSLSLLFLFPSLPPCLQVEGEVGGLRLRASRTQGYRPGGGRGGEGLITAPLKQTWHDAFLKS